jgi:hypothetical protein
MLPELVHATTSIVGGSSDGGDGWLSSLVAAMGVVIAASIAAIAGTFGHHPAPTGEGGNPVLIKELRRRATAAEAERDRIQHRLDVAEADNVRFREYLAQWRINPMNGERVAT